MSSFAASTSKLDRFDRCKLSAKLDALLAVPPADRVTAKVLDEARDLLSDESTRLALAQIEEERDDANDSDDDEPSHGALIYAMHAARLAASLSTDLGNWTRAPPDARLAARRRRSISRSSGAR